jgi:hypothetical protein
VSVDNILVGDGTVTVAAGGNLDVQNLTVGSGGGTITGAGQVTVENSLLWMGGVMNGSGHTVLNGTAEVKGQPSLSSRLLDNFGTAVVDNAAAVVVDNGGIFTNESGATLTLQGTGSLGDIFARQGQVNNAGQLLKAGAGTAKINVALDNTGTIDVQGGTLNVGVALGVALPMTNEGTFTLENGTSGSLGSATSTGDFSLGSGSRLTFAFGGGTFRLQAGATVEAAANAVLEVDATLTQQGGAAVTLAAGSLLTVFASYTLNDGATVSGPGTVQVGSLLSAQGDVAVDNVVINPNGTAAVAAGGNLDVQKFTLAGGILTGAGDLTVETSLLWTSGVMSGAGHTVVGGTADFGGTSFLTRLLSGRLLDNFGTAMVDNGVTLNMTDGAVFTNEDGATLTLQGTGSVGGNSPSGLFSNAGLLVKMGAGTQSRISVPLTNSGTVEIVAGVLLASGGYTQTGDGALTIHIAGLTASSQYGQLQVTGTASLDGTLNIQLDNGFTPSEGDTFRILTFTSRSGDFAVENFPDLGSLFFNPVYDSSGLNLVVQSS